MSIGVSLIDDLASVPCAPNSITPPSFKTDFTIANGRSGCTQTSDAIPDAVLRRWSARISPTVVVSNSHPTTSIV